MTTTALIPYNPDAVDSGFGLRFSTTGALVSVPWGRQCRWLSCWNQAVLCAVWNAVRLVILAVRPHIRRLVSDPLVRACAAFGVAAVVVYVLMTVGPWWMFYADIAILAPLAWRLSVELTETREVAR